MIEWIYDTAHLNVKSNTAEFNRIDSKNLTLEPYINIL